MTKAAASWIVPVAGLVLGGLVAGAMLANGDDVPRAAISFAIIAGYGFAVRILQGRSESVSLLAGLPVDERWSSINVRALSVAAVVLACFIAGAYIVTLFQGGDPRPYAMFGALFAASYLLAILYYRWRS